MGSVHDVIDALRKAPSNSERGTKFERLMVRYFELDPTLSQQYDAVWRWTDWPDRKGKVDTGIDLVARERDTGEYTAIQCKFYEPTHTLSKGDIDSFFTASGKKPFTNRVIISTTGHHPVGGASGRLRGHREGAFWNAPFGALSALDPTHDVDTLTERIVEFFERARTELGERP